MAWSTSRGSSSESCQAAGSPGACKVPCMHDDADVLHCLAMKQTQPAIAQHVQAEHPSAAWPG